MILLLNFICRERIGGTSSIFLNKNNQNNNNNDKYPRHNYVSFRYAIKINNQNIKNTEWYGLNYENYVAYI